MLVTFYIKSHQPSLFEQKNVSGCKWDLSVIYITDSSVVFIFLSFISLALVLVHILMYCNRLSA